MHMRMHILGELVLCIWLTPLPLARCVILDKLLPPFFLSAKWEVKLMPASFYRMKE